MTTEPLAAQTVEDRADPSLEAIPYEHVRVLELVIPPGERRTPIVAARVLVSRMVVTFSMHGRVKGDFPIRPPAGADQPDGVVLFPEAAKVVTALLQRAAEANPAVLAHLRTARPSRTKAVVA